MNALILLTGLTVGGCDAGCCELPRIAPVRRTVRFFVTHKPVRRGVAAVVRAKPVRRVIGRIVCGPRRHCRRR